MLKIFFFLTFFFFCLASTVNSFVNDNKITDKTIRKSIEQSKGEDPFHSVMNEQKSRLLKLMEAFLNGNTHDIVTYSEEITNDMQTIVSTKRESPEKEAVTWVAAAEIIRQSAAMREAAKNDDYKKAYGHYALLANQCIECHQSIREWGKLPEPQPALPAPAPKEK